MKKISFLAVLALISAGSAFAAPEPAPSPAPSITPSSISIKINSFTSIDAQHHLAELCGAVTVTGDTIPRIGNFIAVTVTADPKWNPGKYTTLVSPEGEFCVMIVTYTNQATTEAWFQGAQTTATTEIARASQRR
jgi:hypothetical protein